MGAKSGSIESTRRGGGSRRLAAASSSTIPAPERDGVFRRVHRFESDRLAQHFLRLSPEDRQLRFAGLVSDQGIHRYCQDLDWRRGIVLGYWAGEELRAIGELKLMEDGWPSAAEVALSVEEAWRNRDIGTELIKRLTIIARNRLIGAIHLVCLPHNTRLLQLVRKLDLELSLEPSEARARLVLDAPNQLTIMLECLDHASGYFGEIRRHRRTDGRDRAPRMS